MDGFAFVDGAFQEEGGEGVLQGLWPDGGGGNRVNGGPLPDNPTVLPEDPAARSRDAGYDS